MILQFNSDKLFDCNIYDLSKNNEKVYVALDLTDINAFIDINFDVYTHPEKRSVCINFVSEDFLTKKEIKSFFKNKNVRICIEYVENGKTCKDENFYTSSYNYEYAKFDSVIDVEYIDGYTVFAVTFKYEYSWFCNKSLYKNADKIEVLELSEDIKEL